MPPRPSGPRLRTRARRLRLDRAGLEAHERRPRARRPRGPGRTSAGTAARVVALSLPPSFTITHPTTGFSWSRRPRAARRGRAASSARLPPEFRPAAHSAEPILGEGAASTAGPLRSPPHGGWALRSRTTATATRPWRAAIGEDEAGHARRLGELAPLGRPFEPTVASRTSGLVGGALDLAPGDGASSRAAAVGLGVEPAAVSTTPRQAARPRHAQASVSTAEGRQPSARGGALRWPEPEAAPRRPRGISAAQSGSERPSLRGSQLRWSWSCSAVHPPKRPRARRTARRR